MRCKKMKAAKRRSGALAEVKRLTEAQCLRRATLAQINVGEFSAGVRSIKEQRTAAKCVCSTNVERKHE